MELHKRKKQNYYEKKKNLPSQTIGPHVLNFEHKDICKIDG